eukprot:4306536-Amphidinium_carterae.1
MDARDKTAANLPALKAAASLFEDSTCQKPCVQPLQNSQRFGGVWHEARARSAVSMPSMAQRETPGRTTGRCQATWPVACSVCACCDASRTCAGVPLRSSHSLDGWFWTP